MALGSEDRIPPVEITFSIPHVFGPRASKADEAVVLQLMMEFLVSVNRVYIRRHAPKSLYSSGVVYGRTSEWDSIPAAIERGYADCKTLTAWRIAELREKGIECRPVFRWVQRRNGAKDFHILVAKKGKKLWEDPSKKLGMGNEHWWFRTG